MAQAEKAQVAPGFASAALRCLYAYPTVEGGGGRPTLLRSEGPRRLLVHAPPDRWGWRRPKDERPIDGPAARPQRGHPAKGWYNYSSEESDLIWIASNPFQEQVPLLE